MKKCMLGILLLAMLAMLLCSASADTMLSVTLSDSGVQTTAPGVAQNGAVVKISQPGEYLITGEMTGSILVDCSVGGKVTLLLNGVKITNPTGPAIEIGKVTPRATISLVDASVNELANGETLVFTNDDEPNGVIFSRSDLTITGTGSLKIAAGSMDGIVSKDDLVIKGGASVTVTAPRHGIRGKDSLELEGVTVSVTAGKDGLKSTNTKDQERGCITVTDCKLTIVSGDDPIEFVTRCEMTGTELSITMKK